MFVVHRSNLVEELVAALSQVVASPLAAWSRPETIVVQSRGMERYLFRELAGARGIFAHGRFPFPRAFVEETLAAVLGDAADAFGKERLSWALAGLLPEQLGRPELAPLARYLEGDDLSVARFALCQRIADVFDQYAVFRPDVIRSWEAGRGDGWQPILWRALVERFGRQHLAGRIEEFERRFRTLSPLPDSLPERVCLFGVSHLPPAFLELCALLSERIDVHFFLLSPSQEYWATVRSRREVFRELDRHGTSSSDDLHLQEDNELLASLGRSARDFQQLLEQRVEYVEGGHARYVDPGRGTLLAALKSDIFCLRPHRPMAADGSLQFVSGHGPMREAEVLRDYLLALFHADPSLEPRDVIVMTPDINTYAPFIDAVFSAEPDRAGFIPYSIADRSQRSVSPAVEALLSVLALVDSRMTASELLDLLQLAPVRRRFGMSADEPWEMARLVHSAGIRWGVDAAHRAELGQPPLAENTWRFGLARLLLGYALPARERELFCDVLPMDDAEGERALTVGRLARFAETLFAWRTRLAQPKTLAHWRAELSELVSDVLADDDETAWQRRFIQDAIEGLVAEADAVGFEEAVSCQLLTRALGDRLEAERTHHTFLSGGVTFCELLPMRSIPFRVVCLLGMDDEAFPRRARPVSFDFVAREPRLGDRSLRDEDRQLFLEALLSARDHFYVSWVGQGIQDGKPRPPSVVVGELLDVVGQTSPETQRTGVQLTLFGLPEAPTPKRRGNKAEASPPRVVEHPLTGYSRKYFEPRSSLFSYSATHAAASRALLEERTPRPPLFSATLAPVADDRSSEISLDDLVRFIENPSRHTIERRLGVRLLEPALVVEDREFFELDALMRHDLGEFVLARLLDGLDVEHVAELARASGRLPVGAAGSHAFDAILPHCQAVCRAALERRAGARKAPVELDLDLPEGRVSGTIRDRFEGGRVCHSFGLARPKRVLGLWVFHLASSLATLCEPSLLVCRGDAGSAREVGFLPTSAELAKDVLSKLVTLYRMADLAPVPFLPDASLACALARREGADDRAALAKAERSLINKYQLSELSDPYVQRVIEGGVLELVPRYPDFPSFLDVSLDIYGPLFDHVQGDWP